MHSNRSATSTPPPAAARSSNRCRPIAEVAEATAKRSCFAVVDPLETLARELPLGVLQFHGKIPTGQRPAIIIAKNDPDIHIILMSYGTGSVGLVVRQLRVSV